MVLPLSFSSKTERDGLAEIQKTVERGFDPIYHDSHDVFDQLVVDWGRQHSKEFSYQGIFQRTGLRRRDIVVKIINELRDHGYLQEKRPWADPGIVSYVTGVTREENIGFRLEGAMHTRLRFYQQFLPLKSQLNYFKPYKIDSNNKVKFQPGEIDFVWRIGNRHIPLEVKAASNFSAIDTTLLQTFMRDYRCPYGVVLYGGVPYLDKAQKNHLLAVLVILTLGWVPGVGSHLGAPGTSGKSTVAHPTSDVAKIKPTKLIKVIVFSKTLLSKSTFRSVN